MTHYLYDQQEILATFDDAGHEIARYPHGPGIDEPLAEARGHQLRFYHADVLGSILALTDNHGHALRDYHYSAFGIPEDHKGDSQPYRFTGREWDKQIGLYCYRARYYDPLIGMFLSEDPLGFLGGANSYAYVENDPVNRTDPFGLSDILITVNRTNNTGQSTMGTLTVSVNGGNPQFQGYSLEPSGTTGPRLLPAGIYGASVYASPRLNGQDVLLLSNTSPMAGVEIHPGNYPSDTKGCILSGTTPSYNFVGNSKAAFNAIMGIVNSTQASDAASGQTTTIKVSIQ